ncbi:TP53-regulated inhibitor of apoptosis 1-B-like isoform X2 [Adelges cooleyi]|uniref:TP53-regulated inhibitor of apoptosis 1-B-like isoform X2 n=1 Tax=Adelges cooleyi TaxID=133065 RepID=UPI00217FEC0E|nr:TP53-regulated inhibitor of apoptosis 1-B-like isoform X2 [Adelges cooleyi]
MEECASVKKDYDQCFNSWFKDKYLKGDDDDSMCSELLKNYTNCVKKAMKDRDVDVSDLLRYHSSVRFQDDAKPAT